jgi:purine-binding chemotaxis protein CheW
MHADLAYPPIADAGGTAFIPSALEYLTFKLGAVEYGIDILKVQEIRGYEVPTGLPNAPEHIKGVLDLRGVIVPIFDLRVKFNCESVPFNALTVTVILTLSDRVIGVVVDAVRDVIELTPGQIKSAPPFRGATYADCVTGIATLHQDGAERLLVLLDIEQLFAGAAVAADISAVH